MRFNMNRFSAILLTVILLISILAGAILLKISYLDYGSAKKVIASYTTGKADLFTPELFGSVMPRLHLFGIILITVGVGPLLFVKKISAFINGLLGKVTLDAKAAIETIVTDCKSWLRREDKLHLTALIIIILLAIVVRCFYMGGPLRYDEAYTYVRYASQPLFFGLSVYNAPNNHLFNTFLIHISANLFGDGAWAIRFPAFMAGILLVPAAYVFYRLLWNKNIAIISAGIVAGCPVLVEYSTNARGYSMICLIFLLLFITAIYLLKTHNLFFWCLFSLLGAIGFYTVPVMLYPFGVVCLWLFFAMVMKNDKAVGFKQFLGYFLVSGILMALLTTIFYLPVFSVSGIRSVTSNGFVAPQTWAQLSERVPLVARDIFNDWHRGIGLLPRAVFGAGFIIAALFFRRSAKYPVSPFVIALVWMIPVILVQRVVPPARIWQFMLLLYVPFSIAGIFFIAGLFKRYRIHPGALLSAIVSVLISVALFIVCVSDREVCYSADLGTFTDADRVTLFMKDNLQEGDRVLASSPASLCLHYSFIQHGVATQYLYSDVGASNRLLAVVKKGEHSLDSVLEEFNVPVDMKSRADLVQTYAGSELYTINLSAR